MPPIRRRLSLFTALLALFTSPNVIAANANASSQASAAEPIHVVAVGDVMIGSSYPSLGYLPDDDGKNSFRAVAPYLKGDIVFGNLEGVLLDSNDTGKCGDTPTPNCYAFRMPTRYGQIIKNAGFNLLSIANNHVGDFGDAGRASTLRTLQNLNIQHAGLTQKPSTIFEQNGITYAFVSFAPNLNTISINDLANANNLIKQLRQSADIVIVSFHGGAEGASRTHVPKETEFFLGENRGNVYQFAHAMIDSGADLVLGHGPHVTRAVELYRGKFIAYSLGNFNTYGAFNLRGPNGIAPILNIELDANGNFLRAKVTSIQQSKTPPFLTIDRSHRAYRELRRLTQSDFPDTPLRFEYNQILPK